MRWVRRASVWLSAVLLPLHAVAAPVADLPEIHARGTLRVLVVGDEDETPIQRDGTPAALDRDLAEDFARRQGLKLEIVWVEPRLDIAPKRDHEFARDGHDDDPADGPFKPLVRWLNQCASAI